MFGQWANLNHYPFSDVTGRHFRLIDLDVSFESLRLKGLAEIHAIPTRGHSSIQAIYATSKDMAF